ncbi:MAG: shikimate kinase [Bacillota bacterium]|nr:shikimate kinase [Bacillota bacterium]
MDMNNINKSNIILIGYMGSGKTVIGRQVARLLDFDFADTDEEITRACGMSLPQLFRKHGEIRFRSEERLVLKKLSQKEQLVIACGGSLLPESGQIEILREKGFFVLLTAQAEIIRERLSRKNDRLLLGGRPSLEKIQKLLQEREKHFQQLTDLVVDSGLLDVEEAANHITQAFLSLRPKR